VSLKKYYRECLNTNISLQGKQGGCFCSLYRSRADTE